MLFFLFFFLVLSFMASSVFWFYVFFECSMIPIFFLIMGWGSGQDRLFSGFYMFVYTMISSLPCLLVILVISLSGGVSSFDYFVYDLVVVDSLFYFFFSLVFMVKVPIFIFHIWLPKAHVDAPVYGSMVLACIMLKLGGYGLLRFLGMLGWNVSVLDFFYCVCVVGFFFVSLSCLFSVDMKVIVAYSSVVHMCLMVCSILSGLELGFVGGYLMVLSHGICSSSLFMVINMFYERSGSRLLFMNKGFIGVFPVLSFFWLSCVMFNIGVPPSLSFFSEVYCLASVLSCGSFWWVFFCGLFFMSCVSMSLVFYGFGGWFYGTVVSVFVSEYFLVFFHLFPLSLVGGFLGLMF